MMKKRRKVKAVRKRVSPKKRSRRASRKGKDSKVKKLMKLARLRAKGRKKKKRGLVMFFFVTPQLLPSAQRGRVRTSYVHTKKGRV